MEVEPAPGVFASRIRIRTALSNRSNVSARAQFLLGRRSVHSGELPNSKAKHDTSCFRRLALAASSEDFIGPSLLPDRELPAVGP
jgi:hypothetical protein